MADKKESTLRCVVVLTVIAVVCGVLLAVLNPLLYVAPTADDISKEFDLQVENIGEWQLLELNQDFAGKTSDKSGAAVSLAAKMQAGEETYYGLLITTKAAGNITECQFVMFFTASDNKMVSAKMTKDGTSGESYSYEQAIDRAGAKGRRFEDYFVEINSENPFGGDYSIPKVGATYTLTAVNNAFNTAAYYYYNAIVCGGENK